MELLIHLGGGSFGLEADGTTTENLLALNQLTTSCISFTCG